MSNLLEEVKKVDERFQILTRVPTSFIQLRKQ
jgi:hypothetical protein